MNAEIQENTPRIEQKSSGEHRIDLETILKVATEKNATDIHLQAGLPPILRIQKKLVAVGTEKLSPERMEELMFPIMNEHQKMLFKQNMEYDFSYGVKGLARFRINVFRQRSAQCPARGPRRDPGW